MHAFHFDVPTPAAISRAWPLVLILLSAWGSATPVFSYALLLAVEFLNSFGTNRLLLQDLCALVVLAGLCSHSVLFALVYVPVWARVYPRTLLSFAVRMLLTHLLTYGSTGFVQLTGLKWMPMLPDQVTAAWLEQNKPQEFAQVKRVTVQSLGGLGFVGETVRLRVERNNGEESCYVCKTSVTTDLAKKTKMRASVHVYWRESFFYHTVMPKLLEKEGAAWGSVPMLQVPEVLINKYDPFTGTAMLIMRDESATLETGSQVAGSSWQQAVSVAGRYAQFHALHWSKSLQELNEVKHPALKELGTFDWMDGHPLVLTALAESTITEVLVNYELRKFVPYKLQVTLLRMMRNLQLVFDHLRATKPFTLVHSDARSENMMFPKRSTVTSKMDYVITANMEIDESYCNQRWLALDFQTVNKSLGIFDLAYFVSLDLTFDKSCDDSPDRKLLRYYLAKLEENGVQGYGFDQAWVDYKLCIMLASLTPCVVMSTRSIGGEFSDRAHRTRAAMIQRSFAAMERCGCGEEMDALLDRLLFPVAHSAERPPRTLSLSVPPHFTTSPLATDRALVPEDDSFSHHTEQSVAKLPLNNKGLSGAGRLDAYDRWYLNGYSADGSCYFALACGFYPGRGVVDASFCVSFNGMQYNLRASRTSFQDDFGATSTVVGPIQVDVVEALKRGKITIQHENVECELKFTARFDAVLEPKFDAKLDKMVMDYSRLTQLVAWQGSLTLCKDKKHFEVNNWMGTRDRSWGQRPHPSADRSPLGNKLATFAINLRPVRSMIRNVQFYWLWVPLNFAKLGGLAMHTQELGDGSKANCAVNLFEARGTAAKSTVQSAQVDATYLPGTRHVATCRVTVYETDGTKLVVQCEPLFPFFMSGLGYGSVEFGHGSRPEGARVKFDEICVALADRNHSLTNQIQEVCKLVVHKYGPKGELVDQDVGVGIVEQYVIGPHSPSGFAGFYGV